MTKELLQDGIKRLVEHATELGFTVKFTAENENAYYPILKTIQINSKQNTKSKYYTLLHEFGHALLREESDFSDKYLQDVMNCKKDKNSRIDVLREEIAAWDKCAEFAKQKQLPFCQTTWKNYSKKYIYQYALWTINPQAFINE